MHVSGEEFNMVHVLCYLLLSEISVTQFVHPLLLFPKERAHAFHTEITVAA